MILVWKATVTERERDRERVVTEREKEERGKMRERFQGERGGKEGWK